MADIKDVFQLAESSESRHRDLLCFTKQRVEELRSSKEKAGVIRERRSAAGRSETHTHKLIWTTGMWKDVKRPEQCVKLLLGQAVIRRRRRRCQELQERTGVCVTGRSLRMDRCVFLPSQLVVSLLSARSFFFLPNGGSFHRASRAPRPCWVQVYAESRLTLSNAAAC